MSRSSRKPEDAPKASSLDQDRSTKDSKPVSFPFLSKPKISPPFMRLLLSPARIETPFGGSWVQFASADGVTIGCYTVCGSEPEQLSSFE